ncbi:uncharacterized protein [Elaeis guineensis]|uniref:LOW QUALITY PROTEIN: uncharacterized protein LOC105036948 n=1 Tax=Elaeis guineensis var. tenera TaxID=51953 RepID=A0A6I9QKM9_ELAGV|nr:LOW QUALITY PROTEIN: uncharacterized protein LOC105036948 [Elaeis guineensis]
MESGGSAFLRQLSSGGGSEGWDYYHSKGGSKRWGKKGNKGRQRMGVGGGGEMMVAKKRVMVVIDESARAKHAMMWALTHVANKGDLLTLLHVIPHHHHHHHPRGGAGEEAARLANSLGALCKACNPEVEVEALVIQGPKLATVLSQVRKLEASVLVLSQGKPSPFCCMFRSSSEDFVEQCINKADCLTLAVRKQSKGVGGYLVSTRWQKNFWLLA